MYGNSNTTECYAVAVLAQKSQNTRQYLKALTRISLSTTPLSTVLVLGLAATAEYIAAAGRTAAAVQQRVAETSKHMAKSLT